MKNPETYLNDIDADTARRAFEGMSFSPERRGEDTRRAYAERLAALYAELEAEAIKGGTESLLSAEWERFRAGYKKRYLAWLYSSARCMSTMIAGPSNFPAQQQRKRGEVEHKRSCEINEHETRAIAAIKKTLRPELAPIMTGDADAEARLAEKLAIAENNQKTMKDISAFFRKEKDTEKRIVFLKEKGIKNEFLKEFFIDGDGVPLFSLANNNANIRRLKGRLEEVRRNHATPGADINGKNGIRLVVSPAENRVRLFFPGKPAAETITLLKSKGWRWTPSLGCWQAYNKPWNVREGKTIAGIEEATA